MARACSTLYRVVPNETYVPITRIDKDKSCSTLYRVVPNETKFDGLPQYDDYVTCSTLYRVVPNETQKVSQSR